MSGTVPWTGAYPVRSMDSSLDLLPGSFQGNGAQSPTIIRGNWFTVTWIAQGQYRVALYPQPAISLVGTATNNMGLTIEPHVWVTSESETLGVAPVKYFIAQATRVTTASTFDIFVYDVVGAQLYNVTAADRVNFLCGWKNTGFSP